MFSINLARFKGLILTLIITATSSMGAYTLANMGQTRLALAQAPIPAHIQLIPKSAQSASLAIHNMPQASFETSQQHRVGEYWARTELYFGTKRPDDSEVTIQEFEDFVDEIVTPRFPDGLTLLTGDGQWRNSAGVIIEEESNVLILLYPLDDKEANSEIEQIREAYKDAFQQESVLRVDDYSWVSF